MAVSSSVKLDSRSEIAAVKVADLGKRDGFMWRSTDDEEKTGGSRPTLSHLGSGFTHMIQN